MLDHTQCFPECHGSRITNNILLVIQPFQQGHQFCQIVQSCLLCIVVSNQLVGSIQCVQKLHSSKTQSLRIHCQRIVYIRCLKCVFSFVNAIGHRIGNTVYCNGICNPDQITQAGAVVRSGDHRCLLACIVSNRNLFLTRHAHTERVGKLQSRACKNILNICIGFHALGNQIQKIHSLCLLAFATGNEGVFRNCQNITLFQLSSFSSNNGIDVFHIRIAVNRCSVAIAIGHIQYISNIAEVQRQNVGLRSDHYRIFHIAIQQEIICQIR